MKGSSVMEKRIANRFEVEVPVHLEQGSGVSRDISLYGIYFVTEQGFTEGMPFRFSIEFKYAIPGRCIRLDCEAHVLRVEPQGNMVGIAACIDEASKVTGRDNRGKQF